MGFFANLGKAKFLSLRDKITEAIVKMDPEGATEAELATMGDKFKELTDMLAQSRSDMNKEITEAEKAKESFNKNLVMAEQCQKEIDAGNDVAENQRMLVLLTKKLEALQPEVEREVREADEAKADFEELDTVVREFGARILNAKASLEEAKKKMQRAQVQKERAEVREERSAVLAGLKRPTSAVNVASSAMERAAEKMQQEAEAANTRATILGAKSTEDDGLKKLEEKMFSNADESASEKLSKFKKF